MFKLFKKCITILITIDIRIPNKLINLAPANLHLIVPTPPAR